MAKRIDSFNDYPWADVVRYMGGRLISHDKKAKTVTALMPRDFANKSRISPRNRVVIISDNGGEVNFSEEVPLLDWSVPFTSTAHMGHVGPLTLAYRLINGLTDSPINWKADLDDPDDRSSLTPPFAGIGAGGLRNAFTSIFRR